MIGELNASKILAGEEVQVLKNLNGRPIKRVRVTPTENEEQRGKIKTREKERARKISPSTQEANAIETSSNDNLRRKSKALPRISAL